ncbi:hypothetical protein, partial [Paragemmobacter kunshanensis]|uniref:hypothetical protein n=1 Tax=Paragemmobacter kunshanensis TaxID=2583234 RepID=UPI0019CF8171
MSRFSRMTWLNRPAEASEDAGGIEVVTGERTDFWRETFSGISPALTVVNDDRGLFALANLCIQG